MNRKVADWFAREAYVVQHMGLYWLERKLLQLHFYFMYGYAIRIRIR